MRERITRTAVATALVALIALTMGCKSAPKGELREPPNAPWFEEVAARSGLDFTHRSGHDGTRHLLPESASGGAALLDMDGDGDLDIYLVQSAPGDTTGSSAGNRLFENVSSPAAEVWRFEDVTAGSQAGDTGYGMGVATGDYDNDGDVDLYVTNLGANALLRNDSPVGGPATFRDVTTEAGVGDTGFGASATFLDYDLDGDLDLFVVNYVAWSETAERSCRNRLGEIDYCDPTEYDAPSHDVLYRNDGHDSEGVVRFTDVSRRAGLDQAAGNGLGVFATDFNGDGLPDIFVSNDRMPDHLWINRSEPGGEPRFSEEGLIAGCAIDDDGVAKAGMGVDAVDLDDDGDRDLLVGNFRSESDSCYRNEGSFFVDMTAARGLKTTSRPLTRFGLGFLDFDNDGLIDLFQAAGRVSRQESVFGSDPYAEPNLLFRGRGSGRELRFEEFEPRGGTTPSLTSTARAAAFGDIDNDGAIDILVSNRDGAPHLLRNVGAERGHWIGFRALNEHGSDALGAIVEMRLGERHIWRQVRSGHSYLSASDPRIHLGLGQSTGVTEVSVHWPDGTVQHFGDFAADQIWELRAPY
jgi:hypothetical protein